jgi:patatin-related protein
MAYGRLAEEDMMPTSAATPQDFDQEIRFAVVLYGGVSLAIYINGVAQELLHMVRGTGVLPPGETLSPTERVYRKIGRLLHCNRQPGADGAILPVDSAEPPRTRFVVDIISGTSAGGINGVALAKALALKNRSMDILKKTWLEEAQIDNLFNDQKFRPFKRRTSLLDSDHMYDILFRTLSKFNDAAERTPAAGAFADQIDLFVTATDLNGLYAPIQLADMNIPERVHRTVFHFEYVSAETCAEFAPDRGDINEYGAKEVNDFAAKFDPMLAFAARCTSSFPVAFEPMCFAKIEEAIKAQGGDIAAAKKDFEPFFSAYKAQGAGFFDNPALPLADRPFADGGYLDNRPFSYAIDLIQYRSSTRPVQRKMLFVDPFPEYERDHPGRSEIDFVENAQMAAMTLPRYEVIRGDIERINESNRRQNSLDALRQSIEEDESYLQRHDIKIKRPKYPENFPELFIDDLITEHGYAESYIPYHHLRKQIVTTDLSRGLARLFGFNPQSDQGVFVRLLMVAWRNEKYSAHRKENHASETQFLFEFDVEFRLRRLSHLISIIDKQICAPRSEDGATSFCRCADSIEQLNEIRHGLQRELAHLREARRTLESRIRSPLLPKTRDLRAAIQPDSLEDLYQRVISKRRWEYRLEEAKQVYLIHQTYFDSLTTSLRDYYGKVFKQSRQTMRQLIARSGSAALEEEYRTFQWHDCLSLPFLEGTVAREHSQIEVYRVSPADALLRPESTGDRPQRKLAGTAAADFGGFLQQSWRENDIMWGRLDGAERIITALLPDEADKDLRLTLIREAQDAVLEEELAPDKGQGIFRWLAQRLRKDMSSDVSIDKMIARGNELLCCVPPLQNIIVGKNFRTFVEKYYDVPDPPAPENMTVWARRALSIFSRMLDDLPRKEGHPLRWLSGPVNWSAVVASRLAAFAVPGRLGWRVAEYWLYLVMLSALLLIVIAPLLGVSGVAHIGYAAIAGALALWGIQHAFGRVLLRRERAWRDAALLLVGLVVVIVLAAGVYQIFKLLTSYSPLIS